MLKNSVKKSISFQFKYKKILPKNYYILIFLHNLCCKCNKYGVIVMQKSASAT